MFALRYQIPGNSRLPQPLVICKPVAFSALTSSREQLATATIGAWLVSIKGQLGLQCISSDWTAWFLLDLSLPAACSSAIFRLYYVPELFYFSWQLTIFFAASAMPPPARAPWWHHTVQYECVCAFFIFVFINLIRKLWAAVSVAAFTRTFTFAFTFFISIFIFISFSNTFLSAGHLARLMFQAWVDVVVFSFMTLIVFV